MGPFRNWTVDHWLNFGIFAGGALTAVGITASTQWTAVPALFTPATVIGFLISVMGFLRQTVTNAPRASFQQRTGEPDAKPPKE